MRWVSAEVRKLTTLPGVWLAAAIAIVGPTATVVLAAQQGKALGMPPTPDDGYAHLGILGVIGAIVIGVLAISSEYTADDAESGGGRPINTTLTVCPNRLGLVAAKIAAIGIVVIPLAAVAATITFAVNAAATYGTLSSLAELDPQRVIGVVVFFVLTAWIAFGITLLTRSGTVPMAVLIVNSSLVSVSYLISLRVPAANYLPDLAGVSMFIRDRETTLVLEPAIGGLVMLAWTVVTVAVGAVAFFRRDA